MLVAPPRTAAATRSTSVARRSSASSVMATRRRIRGSSIRYRVRLVERTVRFGVGFFLVEVLCFTLVFDAGFLAVANFALADFVGLLAVLVEAAAAVTPRTSLIALVCSCS